MRRALPAVVAAAACAVIDIGCATTQLKNTWVKPGIGQLAFTRVVAQALSKDGARRRMLEDAMVTEIRNVATPGVEVVAGYTLVPDEAVRDEARMREAMARGGFDGAVMMRITDTRVQETYIPGRTVYAAVSSTADPDSPRDLVERVARVVARDMRENGLLPGGRP
jgi:hypothetical protein